MSGAKTSSKSSQVETIAKRDNMEIASSDLSSSDTVKNFISSFPMKLNNLTNDIFTDFLRFENKKLIREFLKNRLQSFSLAFLIVQKI
jgi:hypothetical protein